MPRRIFQDAMERYGRKRGKNGKTAFLEIERRGIDFKAREHEELARDFVETIEELRRRRIYIDLTDESHTFLPLLGAHLSSFLEEQLSKSGLWMDEKQKISLYNLFRGKTFDEIFFEKNSEKMMENIENERKRLKKVFSGDEQDFNSFIKTLQKEAERVRTLFLNLPKEFEKKLEYDISIPNRTKKHLVMAGISNALQKIIFVLDALKL